MRRLLPCGIAASKSAGAAAAALLLLAAPVRAQEDTPPPFARASVRGAAEVVVGQPVTVVIEVLVPTFFRGAPEYERIDPDGAIAIFNERGTNFTERRDGQTWAGQRRSYTIYPNRAGAYDLDPLGVAIRWGGPGGVAVDTVSSDPVGFSAVVPAEARDLDVFVAADELRLQQAYDPTPDTIRVGDAFTRVVTTEVDGTLSLVIPPLTFDDIEGLAVYPAPPALDDVGGERGTAVTGSREESVTYVAQADGEYELPPVALDWWDWSDGRLRRAELPGVRFVVVANPELVTEIELPPDSLDVAEGGTVQDTDVTIGDALRRWLPRLLVAGMLAMVGWRLLAPRLPRWRRRIAAARKARSASEEAYFRRFEQAARSGDPGATANALAAWLARFDPTRADPTSARLVQLAEDAGLTAELHRLGSILYGKASGGPGEWSGRELVERARAARRHLLAMDRRHGRGTGAGSTASELAPLNP